MSQWTVEVYDRESDSYWLFITVAECESEALDNLSSSRYSGFEIVSIEQDD